MRLQRIIALVLLFVIVVGYLIVPAMGNIASKEVSPHLQAFPGPKEKKGWDQCDKLEGILAKMNNYKVMGIIGSPTILRDIKDPANTLYMAIGVEKQFKEAEKNILMNFVKKGGKVIIADDFGYGDDLSNEYGVTFYGQRMWDVKYFYNASFPIVPAYLNLEPYVLVLNAPTGLANQSYEKPAQARLQYKMLSNGSSRSFVDRNWNGIIDTSDAHENIPVALEVSHNIKVDKEAIGNGKIIFISDPAIFTNDMLMDIAELRARGAPNNLQGYQLDKLKGTNKEFVLALINYLLPSGGKILFDESRHTQESYTAAVYDSIRTITVVTSNPLEAGLLSAGIMMVLFVVVFRAKDKESWIHKFDISSIHRRAMLPDNRLTQVEHLKKALLNKVRMMHSLSVDELRALSPAQIAQMVKDVQLNELLLNEQRTYASDEIRALTAKLKAWGKV